MSCVRVVVRCRPLQLGETNGVNVIDNCEVCLSDESVRFTFDAVFSQISTQSEIFENSVSPIVDQFLNGLNGTIFAYGQTGSGKTHTMFGGSPDPGIALRVFDKIFSEKSQFRVSFMEIYNEEIRDLLAANLASVSEHEVCSVSEIASKLLFGLKNRAVASTLMNAKSSRSHSVFTIIHSDASKLHLVDLAGSERQAKSGTSGNTLKEAAKINLSLSALGNVISALAKGGSHHVPFRDSKLTRFLQESLSGGHQNGQTMMIATISPSVANLDETLSTLRYAHRAKNIKNRPRTAARAVTAVSEANDFAYAQAACMETIRELEKLNRFYESVIHTMIPADVMRRLETTSFYNEVLGVWEVHDEADSLVAEEEILIVDDDDDCDYNQKVSLRTSPKYPKARGLVTVDMS